MKLGNILCKLKEASHKRPRGTWFYLYEIFRIGKFTQTESRLVVATGWRETRENEEWLLLVQGFFSRWCNFNPVHHLWRKRKWQPTPIFLPGKSHGQRSLVGCTPRGCKESDTTERLTHHLWSRNCYYPHFFTDKKTEVEREVELVFKPKYCPFITVYNFSKLFHTNGIIYAEVLCGW